MAAALACGLTAQTGFNGRWDIKVHNEPRSRVWWLQVEGAGTPGIKGMFVGAPGGQLDPIPAIRVAKDGSLEWEFTDRRYERGKDVPVRKGVYRAKLVDGKLQGSLDVEGSPASARQFTGVRAPKIADKDDGTWKPEKPVELFNGKDLTNFYTFLKGVGKDTDPQKVFSVVTVDGKPAIRVSGEVWGAFTTAKEYENPVWRKITTGWSTLACNWYR